ncbi:hypothetical protein [Nitratireductor rhodophyticola]|uniref:hypothetical protein n=1 Tax=Nitratireductor rhodophyticola TaxID=2854036 RepID=UPI00300A77EC
MSYEAWGEPDDSPFEAAAEAGWLNPDDISKAMIDVMNERDRQWNDEGFDPDHDNTHTDASLARAGACYALKASENPTQYQPPGLISILWPNSWSWGWWKPKDRRRDLVRAAALIIAEIERLDRLQDPKR